MLHWPTACTAGPGQRQCHHAAVHPCQKRSADIQTAPLPPLVKGRWHRTPAPAPDACTCASSRLRQQTVQHAALWHWSELAVPDGGLHQQTVQHAALWHWSELGVTDGGLHQQTVQHAALWHWSELAAPDGGFRGQQHA